MNATFDGLKAILVRDYKVDPQTLTPNSTLESLNIDSLGTVELLWTVEEAFGVKLPADPVDLPDVAAVVSYIDGLIAARITNADAAVGAATAPSESQP
jgi:acyl carrier protein